MVKGPKLGFDFYEVFDVFSTCLLNVYFLFGSLFHISLGSVPGANDHWSSLLDEQCTGNRCVGN